MKWSLLALLMSVFCLAAVESRSVIRSRRQVKADGDDVEGADLEADVDAQGEEKVSREEKLLSRLIVCVAAPCPGPGLSFRKRRELKDVDDEEKEEKFYHPSAVASKNVDVEEEGSREEKRIECFWGPCPGPDPLFRKKREMEDVDEKIYDPSAVTSRKPEDVDEGGSREEKRILGIGPLGLTTLYKPCIPEWEC